VEDRENGLGLCKLRLFCPESKWWTRVKWFQEIKAFIRMASGADLQRLGWNGDGTGSNGNIAKQIAHLPGIDQDGNGELHFAEWNCGAGQNNVIIRTDGTVAPCFPMYAATYDWGTIDEHKFDRGQLQGMKSTCQQHCFSHLLQRRSRD
jgi:hypothetical protein